MKRRKFLKILSGSVLGAQATIAVGKPNEKADEITQVKIDGQIHWYDDSEWKDLGSFKVEHGIEVNNFPSAQELRDFGIGKPAMSAYVFSPDGGIFDWVTDSTLSEDGGIYAGRVIRPKGHIGPGAFVRRIKVNDRATPQMYGLGQTGITDSQAIEACYLNNDYIFFPEHEYVIEALHTVIIPRYRYPINYLLEGRSNKNIHLSDKAVIKLKDNFSKDTDPKSFIFFFTDRHLNNVKFNSGTYDLNKDNNPISPDRSNDKYNPYKHSVVLSIKQGISNFSFRNATVKNINGFNALVLAQPITAADVSDAKNAIIEGNTFFNCGYDTYDHTTVNSYQKNTKIIKNNFLNKEILPCASCAFELHNSDSIAQNNIIKKYHRGFFISGNLGSKVDNVIVSNNDINVYTVGGNISQFKNSLGIDRAVVKNNQIKVSGDNYTLSRGKRNQGIVVSSTGAKKSLDSIEIKDNTIEFPAATPGSRRFYGISVTNTNDPIIESVEVSGNKIIHASIGIIFDLQGSKSSVRQAIIRGNEIKDVTSRRGRIRGQGIYYNDRIASPSAYVEITDNQFINTSGSVAEYTKAISYRNAIKHLHLEGNKYNGVFGAKISNGTRNQVVMTGSELRTNWTSRPTYGKWKRGDKIYVNNPKKGNKTIWICVTTGSPGKWKMLQEIVE